MVAKFFKQVSYEISMKDTLTGAEMKKFRLTHGCIRNDNRITSRDTSFPEYHDTREQAESALARHAEGYGRSGYKIWFAHLDERHGEEYIRVDVAVPQPRTLHRENIFGK